MCCEEYKDRIGRFLDNELSPDARTELLGHLQTCSACSLELASLQEFASGISDSGDAGVPSNLWDSIEHRLVAVTDRSTKPAAVGFRLLGSRRWAMAAGLLLVVGLGMYGPSLVDSPARASTINFAVLLDGLPLDARKAFREFLELYDARPGTADDAQEFAPSLDFDTPPTLPGGFRLDEVYLLQFGDRPGVAASYLRDGEFLATIFHAPVKKENFGTHVDYPCVVGKHHGHKIEVGSWKMVHLTDPTTCHCVLSQLDEMSELPAIMAAVAPRATASAPHPHEH